MVLKVIDEFTSEKLLSKTLPVVKSYSFTLLEFKKEVIPINYPIFVKIISKNAVHKVKSGAIFSINSEKDLIKQKFAILNKARTLGARKIIIQEKIYGDELIVGIKEDPKFGKLIMLGMGGKNAEQLKDVAFRVLPIVKKDCLEMLSELRSQAVVKKIDENKLWTFVSKLVKFSENNGDIAFIDLNPVIIESDSQKPIIVDARIYREYSK